MSDRAAAVPNLFGGAIFLAAGLLVELYAAGMVLKDQPPEHPFLLSAVGLAGVIPGAAFLIAGVRMLAPGHTREHSRQTEIAVGCTLAVVTITVLAIGLTSAAVASWQSDQEHRFEGGLTGSMWEHRIVWSVAAAIFDLAAVVVWCALIAASFQWLVSRR